MQENIVFLLLRVLIQLTVYEKTHGSFAHFDYKMDAQLFLKVMSIHSINTIQKQCRERCLSLTGRFLLILIHMSWQMVYICAVILSANMFRSTL